MDDLDRAMREAGKAWPDEAEMEAIQAEHRRNWPEPPTLVWSSDMPAVAGRYWIRRKNDNSIKSVWNVTENDVANPPPWFKINQFAGPIPEPKEAAK